jgi:hypothetical protein
MKISWSLTVGISGLILMLGAGPSWGQVPEENDKTADRGNTGGGSNALRSISGVESIGFFNTAYGEFALVDNTGSNNTAVGSGALISNLDGDSNTAVGERALVSNQTGDSNTAIGNLALQNNRNGSGNIGIGVLAGFGLQQGSNNIYLGNRVAAAAIGENRVMRLGGNQSPFQINRTFIAGIHGVTLPSSGMPVLISSTGQLGTAEGSSARYKHDIQPIDAHSRRLLQLRPVTFRYKQDVQEERQYGLIAEEVAEVYPELVIRGTNGEVESVRYHGLIPMLLNELQHQQGQVGAQAQELSVLKAENEQLRAMVAQRQERDEAVAVRLERLEEAAAAREATLPSR